MPAGVPVVTVQLQPAAKPWWRSRTLWLNALALGLAVAEARLGLLKNVLPISAFEAAAFALPVLNAVLRLVTSTAVTAGAPQPIPVPAPDPAPTPTEEKAP
jgi:hypothetical protein